MDVFIIIGISVLTLLINYGDISGLAKPKERIPTLSDISVSETLKREKYEWMKCMVRWTMCMYSIY